MADKTESKDYKPADNRQSESRDYSHSYIRKVKSENKGLIDKDVESEKENRGPRSADLAGAAAVKNSHKTSNIKESGSKHNIDRRVKVSEDKRFPLKKEENGKRNRPQRQLYHQTQSREVRNGGLSVNNGSQFGNGITGAHNKKDEYFHLADLDVATYNVRDLNDRDKLTSLITQMKEAKWDVIGLSDIRRKGETFTTLESGHLLYEFGMKDQCKGGVGFLVHRRIAQKVEVFKRISPRVIYTLIHLPKYFKVKIIQVVAPSYEDPEEELEVFYSDIERVLTSVRTYFTIIIGDFSAKVGQRRPSESAIGKFGVGERDERGERLMKFVNNQNYKVMNTMFQKQQQSRWTWQSPDGEKSETDLILTNRPYIVTNVQASSAVDIGSDHRLIRCHSHFTVRKDLAYSKLRSSGHSFNNLPHQYNSRGYPQIQYSSYMPLTHLKR